MQEESLFSGKIYTKYFPLSDVLFSKCLFQFSIILKYWNLKNGFGRFAPLPNLRLERYT